MSSTLDDDPIPITKLHLVIIAVIEQWTIGNFVSNKCCHLCLFCTFSISTITYIPPTNYILIVNLALDQLWAGHETRDIVDDVIDDIAEMAARPLKLNKLIDLLYDFTNDLQAVAEDGSVEQVIPTYC
jgi:hypothetical protein